ncbi:helix-turn-helix domain-containing protein [Desulfotomaculum copahuensis]|uniref:DNA-binding protein n=1 Tax=Desulfotomaculum copahuensis TaxID=1838280 RepID=A0A1B7LF45_9FIRM|nr:helix-turn-helix domain-containing protein [Desulfotomaculum copahuensis]OAT82210.1 DNA-binding protein [Desulfotomaculum copahuensis]
MDKKLLRLPEVAEILDLKEDRVYALAREGILPVVHVGRQLRVDPDKLLEWIDNGGKAFDGGWKKTN